MQCRQLEGHTLCTLRLVPLQTALLYTMLSLTVFLSAQRQNLRAAAALEGAGSMSLAVHLEVTAISRKARSTAPYNTNAGRLAMRLFIPYSMPISPVHRCGSKSACSPEVWSHHYPSLAALPHAAHGITNGDRHAGIQRDPDRFTNVLFALLRQ